MTEGSHDLVRVFIALFQVNPGGLHGSCCVGSWDIKRVDVHNLYMNE